MHNFKYYFAYDIKDSKTVLRQILAELIGTILLVALGILSTVYPGSDPASVSLANGLCLASTIQIFGHISGAHFNPAISLAACASTRISASKFLLYTITQLIGSILGAFIAYGLSPSELNDLGVTKLYKELSVEQTCGIEIVTTFLLTAVYMSVTDGARGSRGLGSASLAVGLAYTAGQRSCVGYGGSLNPARSFGPAVVMDIWTDHWVFWVGPLTGAVIAGLIYQYVFADYFNWEM